MLMRATVSMTHSDFREHLPFYVKEYKRLAAETQQGEWMDAMMAQDCSQEYEHCIVTTILNILIWVR